MSRTSRYSLRGVGIFPAGPWLALALLVAASPLHASEPAVEWKARLDAANQALGENRLDDFRSELAASVAAARLKADDAIALADELVSFHSFSDVFEDSQPSKLALESAVALRSYAYGARDWRVAEPLDYLSEIESAEENYSRAEELLYQALSIRRESLSEVHLDVLQTYIRIGSLYLDQDKVIAADEALGQAMSRRALVVGIDSTDFADTLDEAAAAYEQHNRFDRADSLRQRSRRVREASWGENDPRTIEWLLDYASSQGFARPDVAQNVYADAWQRAVEHHGLQSSVTAMILSRVAAFRHRRKEYKLAEEAYRQAIAVRSQVPEASDPDSAAFKTLTTATAWDLASLGAIATELGRHADAAQAFDQRYQALATILSIDEAQLHRALRRSAQAYQAMGDYGMANERLRELLDIRVQLYGEASPQAAESFEELGDTSFLAKDYAAAAGYFEQMVAILETQDPPRDDLYLKLFKLGGVYAQLGRTADANRVNSRAYGLMLDRVHLGDIFRQSSFLVLLMFCLSAAFMLAVMSGLIWGGAAISGRMLNLSPAYATAGSPMPLPTEWPPETSADSPPAPLPDHGQTAAYDFGENAAMEIEETAPPVEHTDSSDIAIAESPLSMPLDAPSESQLPSAFPARFDEKTLGSEIVDANGPVCGSEPAAIATPVAAPEEPLSGELLPGGLGYRSRRFQFEGEGGRLFSIWVINLLLTIVTLGVYYFWGKARIRKYVYIKTSLDEDPFHFHGTGRELFVGWLKALPFLVVFIYGPTVLMIFWASQYAELIGSLAVIALLTVVWPLAVVGAFRYRLSRSSWRGIRFSFRGLKRQYVLLGVGTTLLTVVSLGLASPFCNVWLRRYLFNRAWFGDTRFRFEGKGQDLFGPFMIAVILTPLTLGLYWLWYSAQRENYYWSRTFISTARFRCTLTGWKLFRLKAGNLLLLVGTLGLAWPWTLMRSARVRLENLFVEGPFDLGSIRQDAQAATATAEGFADFLGVDFGI